MSPPMEVTDGVQEVNYGFPFTGYDGALTRDRVPRHKLAVDSHDWRIDPSEGKLVRRRGTTNTPADGGGLGGTAGLLESAITYGNGYRMRGLQLEPLRFINVYAGALPSPQSHLVLFVDEDNQTGAYGGGVAAPEAYGQLYWYNPNVTATNGGNRVLALGGVTGYPIAGGASGCQPWPFLGQSEVASVANRFAGMRMGICTAAGVVTAYKQKARAKHAAGGRSVLEMGNWVYIAAFGNPNDNVNTTYPHAWNRGDATFGASSGTRIEWQVPMGHVPGMWMPRITLPAAAAAGVAASWDSNDVFFISVGYIWEDGSFSLPCIPRLPSKSLGVTIGNDISPATGYGGYGLVVLGAYASPATNRYEYIQWRGIPCAPPGAKATVLYRSPKTKLTAATTFTMPDPRDLRIVAIIPPTQTSYDDPAGGSLDPVDPNLLYWDQVWAPRMRYLFPFDQRIAAAYVREQPNAILITLKGLTATSDELNVAAEQAANVGPRGDIRLWTNDAVAIAGAEPVNPGNNNRVLDLIAQDGGAVNPPTCRRYLLSNFATLQELVDAINSNTLTVAAPNQVNEDVANRWHAQLVPGADGNAPLSALADFPAANNGSVPPYGSDVFGDQYDPPGAVNYYATAAATRVDGQRTFGPGQPGVIQFSSLYLDTKPTFKDTLYFTAGGPGHPANAARSFRLKNNRKIPAGCGEIIGGSPLLDGALVACTKRICVLRNIRDGKTGIDDDYRIEELRGSTGAISPAIGRGNGFAVYLTSRGVVAGSEEGELLLPGLYNPTRRTGDLAYEISECEKAVGADNFDQRFACYVTENQIWISYRHAATTSKFVTRYMVLDFSPGQDKTGLKALIDDRREIDGQPNPGFGKPFGWSSPFIPNESNWNNAPAPSAYGIVHRIGERLFLGTRETALATGDDGGSTAIPMGRVDQYDIGVLDTADTITPEGFLRTDRPSGHSYLHTAEQLYAKWKKNASGLTLKHARQRDAHTTNPGYFTSIALASSGTDPWAEDWFDLTLAQRAPTEVSELKIDDDGTGSVDPEVYGVTMRFGLSPKLQ